MAYCALTDLVKRLPSEVLIELTDDTESGVVDSDVITAAIVDADSEINSYCGQRYTDLLPFSPVPERIKALSISLAIDYLYCRRPEGGVPESVERSAENARDLLRRVARGEAQVGVGPVKKTERGLPYVKSLRTEVFTDENLANF